MPDDTTYAPLINDAGYRAAFGYQTAKRFTKAVWSLSLLFTVTAILMAWTDRSWGALWIAFVGAPIINLILMLVSLIGIWVCRRRNQAMPKAGPMMAAIFAPLSSSVIIVVAIFSMELHGC